MANEITLNPYEQVEGELSAEELDSYLELQKRLSGKEEPEVEEAPQEEEEAPTEEGGDLYETIMESYRTGEWDPEVVGKVEGMDPVDVANMFLTNQQAQQQSTPQATEADIEQIQQAVGGSDEYQSMIQWAGQNLSEQEVAMYDAVMDRGDPLAMFFAAQALNARYQDAVGYDGEMLTGSAPRNTGDGFRSQAELVAAMSDPRYDKDPAYRADVADKLERSNINF